MAASASLICRRLAWPAALLLGLAGCVEPYVPDVVSPNTGYLVVDGFINGNGRSTFNLSRSIGLTTTTAPPPEKGAKVSIVDLSGGRFALVEKANGLYQSDSLVLNPAHQYQLSVQTSAGGQYLSDATPLKVTPPLDKLGWRLSGDNVELQVSAHDATGQSRYYRWQFTETWQFNAAFESKLQYQPGPGGHGTLVARTVPIYTCWRTERPSLVAQATTTQLSQDAITNRLIYSFPQRAERVKVRYSVLVSQYVETPEEYAYLELLRKNTESVGTVNDPLPVQLTGNVHRVGNPAEPVLGFVGAHTTQQQRLFIDKAELPARDPDDYDTPYTSCRPSLNYYCDAIDCHMQAIIDLFLSPGNVPIDYGSDAGGAGVYGANLDCADCRTRGTTTKPSFW